MKLLNYTSAYFSVILLIIIPVWAGIFYFAMLDEIYDSMDDGLGNQKLLIIKKAALDSGVLGKRDFDEGNYAISPIAFEQARDHRDIYLDTLMYMQNENDYEPVRMLKTVFEQDKKYYFMRVTTSMVEEDDLITELLYSLLWLYLGLVFTILVLNNLLLKKIWHPFNKLIGQLSKFRLEKARPVVLPVTKIDEFNTLNHAIDKLLKTNITAYNSQKQFIENASHELQTPLAISINKLEILAEDGGLNFDQAALVSSALDNLSRLNRLNRSLLLLSKIENNQFPEETEIHINQLINRILNEFNNQLTFRNIVVTVQELDDCIMQMNPDLADILFSNLIRNAISHNHPHGHISIDIRKEKISIRNSGKNAALDGSLIFNRFYKDPFSNSSGIGLAIVKAIAGLYNLDIIYDHESDHGFTIRKKFPILS